MAIKWGYKRDGSACLFDLEEGAALPQDWSADHMIIEDHAKRTADAITAAAGSSVITPVKIVALEHSDQLIAVRRGPGRPPGSVSHAI